MKKLSLFAVFLVALTSLSTFAAEYRIRRVQTLGTMKHKVIFQSRDLKAVRGSNHLVGQLVLMWGTHRYEIVDGLYTCSEKNFCKIVDYKRVAMFEKCYVKKNKVDCVKPVSGRYSSNESGDIRVWEDPDHIYDEFDNGRDSWDSGPEFPVRVNDEFGGIVLF